MGQPCLVYPTEKFKGESMGYFDTLADAVFEESPSSEVITTRMKNKGVGGVNVAEFPP